MVRILASVAVSFMLRDSLLSGEAVDAYQRALDLINLASAKWETVPKANLSPWLSPPIVRGVQCGFVFFATRAISLGLNGSPQAHGRIRILRLEPRDLGDHEIPGDQC